MTWDNSGNFVRGDGTRTGPNTWTQARDASVTVNAPDADTHDQDIADGLENCVTRDGQNSPITNLPMNSKKHTGVADASENSEYAAYGQLLALVDAIRCRCERGRDSRGDHAISDTDDHQLRDRQGISVLHRDGEHWRCDAGRREQCGGHDAPIRWDGICRWRSSGRSSRDCDLQRLAVAHRRGPAV